MQDNYFIICSVIYFIKYWEHVKHVLQLITVNQSLFSAFCNLFLWYKLPISYCTCTLETKTKTVVIKVYRMGPYRFHNVVKWFFSNLHYCKSLWNPKSAFWKMNLQNSLYIYKQMISTIKNLEEMIICDGSNVLYATYKI